MTRFMAQNRTNVGIFLSLKQKTQHHLHFGIRIPGGVVRKNPEKKSYATDPLISKGKNQPSQLLYGKTPVTLAKNQESPSVQP